MKDEKKNKRKVLPEGEKKKRIKKLDPKHQQEQEQLFSQADSISPINKQINKAEIVELNNGEQINITEYILENYVEEKSTHFFECFYFLIADLMGVSRGVMKTFIKPLIVPLLKRYLIYGRLPDAVQRRLYKKNPYTGYCTRSYWNYQYLTKKADLMVIGFIDDFQKEGERVLAANGDIKAFIIAYGKKFNVSIQPELFW